MTTRPTAERIEEIRSGLHTEFHVHWGFELLCEIDALRAERDEARRKHAIAQRRFQQAESACMKFQREWDAAGGPRGGNFGRGLLAVYARKLEKEKEAAEADAKLAAATARSAKAQRALTEVESGIRALREEIARNGVR